MADEGPPPRLKGQLDVYDCIRVAEENLDGVHPEPTFAAGDELDLYHQPSPVGKPRPLTAAEVVALRLKETNEE